MTCLGDHVLRTIACDVPSQLSVVVSGVNMRYLDRVNALALQKAVAPPPTTTPAPSLSDTVSSTGSPENWICKTCTYINHDKLFLACEMCGAERVEETDSTASVSGMTENKSKPVPTPTSSVPSALPIGKDAKTDTKIAEQRAKESMLKFQPYGFDIGIFAIQVSGCAWLVCEDRNRE